MIGVRASSKFAALILLISVLQVWAQDHSPSVSGGLVPHASKHPDPDSDDYWEKSETTSEKRIFNASPVPIEVKTVRIRGYRLVFDSGSKAFLALNKRRDLLQLDLAADTIIFRKSVQLPGTRVTIAARELIFEADSRLDTSPLDDWTDPQAVDDSHSQPGNSSAGQNGGDVSLLIERLIIPPCASSNSQAPQHAAAGATITITTEANPSDLKGCPVRIVTNGGRGQQAGKGRDGVNGTSLEVVKEDGGKKAVYVNWGTGTPLGTLQWPGDGTPPVPDGKPGNGGNAGAVASTLPAIEKLVAQAGGSTGRVGELRSGSSAGEPTLSYHLFYRQKNGPCHRNQDCGPETVFDHEESHTSKGYPDVPAPLADRDGRNGIFTTTKNEITAYLPPWAFEETLKYLRDLYIAEYYDEARARLAMYSQLLSGLGNTDNADTKITLLLQQRQQVDTLLDRVSSHLDYFGNPAGFVPQLSLEYNLQNYEAELRFAIPTLYAIRWLNAKERSLEDKSRALQLLLNKSEGEITTSIRDYNALQGKLGGLQNKALAVKNEGDVLQQKLSERQNELKQRAALTVEEAHRLPMWKQSLGTLGTLCKVVPIYQPALAAIGTGLTAIASAGNNDPLTTAQTLSDVSDSLSTQTLNESYSQLKEELASYDPANYSGAKAFAKAVVPKAQKLLAAQQAVKSVTSSVEAPQSEVEAEFAKLAQQDEVFQDLTKSVREHSQKLAALNLEAATLDQTVGHLASQIAEATLTVASIHEALNNVLAAPSPEVSTYLEEMEQRAKDRLLKYHYYVAKSYEYRTLRSYPSNVKLDSQFDHLLRLAEQDTSTSSLGDQKSHAASLTQKEFDRLKFVYEEPLREITSQVVEEYNGGNVRSEGRFTYTLSEDQLKELNAKGGIVLNFEKLGLIRQDQTEQRIIRISSKMSGSVRTTSSSLEIQYRHPPVSDIESSNVHYIFRHPAPFYWTSKYDLESGDESEETISPGTESLLRQLLPSPSTEASLQLFTQPSLRGDLEVKKVVIPKANDAPDILKKLTVVIAYEYKRKGE